MNKHKAALLKSVRENRFACLSFPEIALLYGWGKNIPGALAVIGAPVIARRMNPELLLKWLETHGEAVSKLRSK